MYKKHYYNTQVIISIQRINTISQSFISIIFSYKVSLLRLNNLEQF